MTTALPSPAESGLKLSIKPGAEPNATFYPQEAADYMKAHAELVRIADLLMTEPTGVGLRCEQDGHV